MSDEVDELCPRMSDATHTLRLSRGGTRLPASRLSEVRQVRTGLPHEDYDIELMNRETSQEYLMVKSRF